MDERRRTSNPRESERADNVSRVARGFRAGRPEAAAAVRRRIRNILRYRGFGMSAEQRRDLEQEIVTQLWQAVNRPSADLGADFWGLVEVVTARRSIDWLRRRREFEELDAAFADPAAGPLARAISRERSELAARALEHLPAPCRELIYLHTAADKSYREISELLGKTEGALRVQMHRCIREARRLIAELQRADDETDD